MKNTTKRVWSILLAACMLLSLFSMAAFAESGAPVIVRQPEYADPDENGNYVFAVEATGEDLTYEWFYSNSDTGNEPATTVGVTDHFSGGDTNALTAWGLDCVSGTRFVRVYCVVTNAEGSVTSSSVGMNYVHGVEELTDYAYDAECHLPICGRCWPPAYDISMLAEHNYEGGAACVDCGYDPANPVPGDLIIFGLECEDSVSCGSDVTITADVLGLDLTYTWQIWDDEADDYVDLTDGENVQGATTKTLTLKNVTTHGELAIKCLVSNEDFTDSDNTYIYVNKIAVEGYQITSLDHSILCTCGKVAESGAHSDSDNDRVCDECDYAFSKDAPIITAHPKDSYTENGEDATFTVAASGKDLAYQWYYGSDPLEDDDYFSGTTTATLKVHSVVGLDPDYVDYDCNYDGDEFYCVVSNGQGAVASNPAVQHVEHVQPGEWESDEFTHTRDCICGRTADDDYHEDADKNNTCDVCGAEFKLPFSDISDAGMWYYDATVYSYMNGIFTGDYGRFLPEDNITRGEVATVLARIGFTQEWIEALSDAEFEQLLQEIQKAFGVEDVKTVSDIDGYFYERHARLLCAIGVIKGYEDATFRGENEISRQEMAIMLKRFAEIFFGDIEDIAFGDAVKAFKDENAVADWAEAEVEWCRKAGVFRGDENAYFHPEDEATRAEIAQTLMRLDFLPGLFAPSEE